jgi:hypothetical protein
MAACSSFGRSSLPEKLGSGNANDLNVFKTAVWDQGLGVRGTLEVLGDEIDDVALQPLPVCLKHSSGVLDGVCLESFQLIRDAGASRNAILVN